MVARARRQELEIATRRCVARVLWAAAVEAAAAGRDPAPIAATARHLIGGARSRSQARARRRAGAASAAAAARRDRALAATRATSRPMRTRSPRSRTFDPWLARLGAGAARSDSSRLLVELRRPALFSSIAGPALAALAERAHARKRQRRAVRAKATAARRCSSSAAGALVGSAHRRNRAPHRRRRRGRRARRAHACAARGDAERRRRRRRGARDRSRDVRGGRASRTRARARSVGDARGLARAESPRRALALTIRREAD